MLITFFLSTDGQLRLYNAVLIKEWGLCFIWYYVDPKNLNLLENFKAVKTVIRRKIKRPPQDKIFIPFVIRVIYLYHALPAGKLLPP